MSEGITLEVAGVLFDMDGVLISSIGSVNRSWRRWAKRYGVPNAKHLSGSARHPRDRHYRHAQA